MARNSKHILRWISCILVAASFMQGTAIAQDALSRRLSDASDSLLQFASDGALSAQVLDNAYGIAVIPNVIRGGFILGGRRGKGVLTVRDTKGVWSNPSFIQLTGGSIGWQIGVETADIVLIFANETSVRNIQNGRFTLSGDATAIAGPTDARSTAAVTFKSEIYAYVRAKGLFAGASLEGTRLGLDSRANSELYGESLGIELSEQSGTTPSNARRFLLSLETLDEAQTDALTYQDTATTFPLDNEINSD